MTQYVMRTRMRMRTNGSENVTNLMQRMRETKDDDDRKGV